VLPPLRFETFSLLLREAKNELQQSYERTSLFAGRVRTGDQRRRDWAPIYLSDSLIDTEFGALLNITDQMLKGWSEAGRISYLYFTYPYTPPDEAFVFGKRALSDILIKEKGASWVLFNWNTSGLTTINEHPDYALLAVHRTGSLPVTYGSEAAAGGGMKTGGELIELEDQAFDYFSSVKDPNLARVVQYTLLYQVFRAAAQRTPPAQPMQASLPVSDKHQKAAAALAAETQTLLEDIDGGRLMPMGVELTPVDTAKWRDYVRDNVAKPLAEFRKKHPDLAHNGRLAAVLADSRAQHSAAVAGAENLLRELPRLQKEAEHFEADQQALTERAQQLKERATQFARRHPPANNRLTERGLPADLRMQLIALRAEREALDRRGQYLSDAVQQLKGLEATEALFGDVRALEAQLRKTVSRARDLGKVQQRYIEASSAEPDGSIKTPSAVVSWDLGLELEGGHNLNSRALKIEVDPAVRDVEIVAGEGGTRVRVNPRFAEAASTKSAQIARLVEHGHERNPKVLQKLLEERLPPVRARMAALEMPLSGQRVAWKGRIEDAISLEEHEAAQLREQLSPILDSCKCDAVAARDANGFRVIAERDAGPPPHIVLTSFADTGSFQKFLLVAKGRSQEKARTGRIFFVAEHPEHVQALADGLETREVSRMSLMRLARGMGERDQQAAGYINVKNPQARATIRVIEGGESLGARGISDIGISARYNTWTKAKPSRVEISENSPVLREHGWRVDRDGAPHGVELSFARNDKTGGHVRALLVAGLDGTKAAKTWFTNLVAKTQKRQAALKGSLMDGYGELRAYVAQQAASPGGVKRLLLIIEDDRLKVIITQRSRDELGG
jgi:hypothetical protein